jgi:hypothetical protein
VAGERFAQTYILGRLRHQTFFSPAPICGRNTAARPRTFRALKVRQDRHQHVRAGHLLAARRLDMDHGALDHALKASGRSSLALVDYQFFQVVVDVAHAMPFQRAKDAVSARQDRPC